MTQREAVYKAVLAVFGEVNGSMTNISKEQRKDIEAEVVALFQAGEVEYRGGVPEEAKLKKYVNGLVNNWFRKDPRLNGGVKYQAKNPGSRQGSGDESMRAMRALLSATTDSAARTAIQAEIDKRAAELAKAKAPAINVAALPESLRHLAPTAA